MEDLLETIAATLSELSDKQKADIQRTILISVTGYFGRRTIRKFLVAAGVQDAVAKRAYGAVGYAAWVIGCNLSSGARVGEQAAKSYA